MGSRSVRDGQVSSEYTVRDQERMLRASRYFTWRFRLAEAELGDRVLESGCGLGNFACKRVARERVIALDVESSIPPPFGQSLFTVLERM
jgi:hypothetical protein